MWIRRVLFALSIVVLLSAVSLAQGNAPKVDENFVHQAFGRDFTMISEIPAMTADMDGDGVEDVVIAARCKNPLLDEAEHGYVVLDPYNSFYGYGDPKVTMSFGDDNPIRKGLVVLIIHGSGPDAWRSAAPKAKFVIINQPYRGLSVRRMKLGKKLIEAVYVEEGNDLGETSALFFDGKKYKYEPMGSSMQ